ncbi:P-II family nitrogen regulator [Thermocrinis minervae]|uniref:Nitrogen regulatory protein P-II family n=1 Tax=Thermocrinis minervae TaxID=381751 RepID=A0A1M6SB91_9AQUI|nr:transcriptional regulator [Thermocrinis minervae]SHK42053.1 nitrogen regulatory protein P-II family [Thermocrinis minervae]
MKKVEVVIDSLHLNDVLKIFEEERVSGYTVIRDVEGMGERGLREGDELTGVYKNSYAFTVCEDDKAERIVQRVGRLIKRLGGICVISDVQLFA